jgi:hypothetical protein
MATYRRVSTSLVCLVSTHTLLSIPYHSYPLYRYLVIPVDAVFRVTATRVSCRLSDICQTRCNYNVQKHTCLAPWPCTHFTCIHGVTDTTAFNSYSVYPERFPDSLCSTPPSDRFPVLHQSWRPTRAVLSWDTSTLGRPVLLIRVYIVPPPSVARIGKVESSYQ